MAYHQGLLRQKGFGGAYHRGVLRQKGFGIPVGALLKIGGPLLSGVLAPVVGDLVGGLIKKQRGRGIPVGALLKIGGPLLSGALGPVFGDLLGGLINKQRGRGIFTDVMKGGYDVVKKAALDKYHNRLGFMDSLRRGTSQRLKAFAIPQVESQLMRNVPAFSAPIVGNILRGKVLPMIKNKVATAIEANVNKYMGAQRGRGRKRRKKQRGRGVATDLIKMGAKRIVGPLLRRGGRVLLRRGIKKGLKKGAKELVKEGTRQAIHSATKVGIDALKGKSLKESVVKRGQEGLQKTGMSMEEKLLGNPQILARGGPKTNGSSNKRKRKRTIKLGTGKKARTIDIFD